MLRGEGNEELGARAGRTADLQVRRARTGERAASEQRAAQVGAAAARARDDATGRALERPESAAEDACLVHQLERPAASRNVELVARLAAERPAPVGADLRRNLEIAQESECAARDGGAGEV